jgi:hypothetical protein
MSASAIVLMALAMTLVWGGLIASTVFLIRRPEVTEWPEA